MGKPGHRRFAGWPVVAFGQKLPPAPFGNGTSLADWQQANPKWIARALEASQALPSGGWYVVDATRVLHGIRRYRIADRTLVVWRAGDRIRAAPDACPHMGAPLSEGHLGHGRLVCPWHGMMLCPDGQGGWKPLPSYDDGVLFWVRIDGPEPPTERPFLPSRPRQHLDAVVRLEARCEPQDVIANRLDPWHGVHFHPHSFGRLRVLEQRIDALTVRVGFRVAGPACVVVDARFHCVDPRTIVMTIVAGEGRDSVVETHATPVAPGGSAIVEATLATSERIGFQLACHAACALRPLMRWAALRLWSEDAAYAERRYALRTDEAPESNPK